MGAIQIEDKNFHTILSATGYPVIPLELLEYPADDIKNIIIREAMEDYFTRFPIKRETTEHVTGKFSIPFPEEEEGSLKETYGVVDARVLPHVKGHTLTGNPFHDQNLVIKGGGTYNRMYDVKGKTSFAGLSNNTLDAMVTNRMVAGAMHNQYAGTRIIVNLEDDCVVGSTTKFGELRIRWAQSSEKFEDIPRKHQKEVIWLAQSILLKRLAMLRSQSNTGMGVDFNTQEFTKESDALERKVREKWAKRKSVVVIR